MDNPRVAVIILNYNGRDLLEKYLPSISDLRYDNYRTIVVDNDSTDSSVEYLNEEFPDVQVIQKVENAGISGGYNAGAEAAPDADYCWFMNNDVRVTPSSLSTLIERIESEPQVGVVFPRYNNMGSEVIQSLGLKHDIFGYRGWPEIGKGRREPTFTEPREIVHGKGAAMLVDRSIWAEMGGFDEENFIYGDDSYLCLQAWLRGYHVEVVPEAVVYHEEDVTIDGNPMKPYHQVRSRTRTYLKSLQGSTLAVGFPGFVALLIGQVLKDVLVKRRTRTPLYRLAGFVSALLTLPGIYSDRQELKKVRVYEDDQFLTPVSETWLSNET